MSTLRLERSGSPRGLKRLLFRAPILLFRAGLGFVFGKRFLMLEHTGRKSGETRRTVLEVVVNSPDAVFVAAGWGSESQWLKNLQANPEAVFYLGTRRYQTRAGMVGAEEAREIVADYALSHPKAADRLAAFMLDDPGETTEERVRLVAELVPIVKLSKGVV